jgi:HTH-type transcriptional regulator/antitoxin HipB
LNSSNPSLALAEVRTKSIRSDGKPRQTAWASRLSSAVRERRRALNLTQIELCNLAGCGPAFPYALENGKNTLRFDKVVAVLHILGLQLVIEPGQDELVTRVRS